MHEINDRRGLRGPTAICNCCGCSCLALRTGELLRTPRAMLRTELRRRAWTATSASPAASALKTARPARSSSGSQALRRPGVRTVSAYLRHRRQRAVPPLEATTPTTARTAPTSCRRAAPRPCKAECPAHIPVQGYIKLACHGRYIEALELIKQENPFPAVCGRICNTRCEDACTRGSYRRPHRHRRHQEVHRRARSSRPRPASCRKMLNQTGTPLRRA